MRIAFVNLTGGGLSGGGRKTMTRLLPQLKQFENVEIKLFIHPKMNEFGSAAGTDFYMYPQRDYLLGYRKLKSEIRKYNPDIVFIPNSIHLKLGNIPTIIMVRNMEVLTQPIGGNNFRDAIKNLIRRYIYKQSCRKATRIIAISQFVKSYLVENWHIASRLIDVVYHGVDIVKNNLVKPPILCSNTSIGKFILTAGSFTSYRGYEDLINAFSNYSSDDITLVIAGDAGKDQSYKNRIQQMVKDSRARSRIILTGFLPPEEMSWCYSNCSTFVMTSRIEACPNIVLEALSFGCINISTMSPPMPEIFGDAAQYYTAGDANQLHERLAYCIDLDETKREKYSEIARKRAICFSWKKNAKNLIKSFEKTLTQERGNFQCE